MTDARTPEDPRPGLRAPANAASEPAAPSAFEAAPTRPEHQVGNVAQSDGPVSATGPKRGRSGLRWALALIGVLVIIAASAAVVSLVGGKPAASSAMGYMPSTVIGYSEIRLDLPGDQRQKLATFLKAFPGFDDPSAIQPKLEELLDRLVRAATKDKQTWTTDIQPWFGGQIAMGVGLPDVTRASTLNAVGMANGDGTIAVATITDRARAIAWLTSSSATAPLARAVYGGADLFSGASGGRPFAVAVTDKAMLAGTEATVKAAVDTNGRGTLDQNADVKAAFATVDRDYVFVSIIRTRAYAEGLVKMMAAARPGVLDGSQLDETLIALVPAWQLSTARFENDALVASSASPSWPIGSGTQNRPSTVLGHVPARTILYLDVHDAGPALAALLDKFRALPELKAQFAQFDKALSLVGGFDAVFGWWGDTALVVAPMADGTLGGGLVIKPRDVAASNRLLTTLAGFAALAGGSSGIAVRTEDHNGTTITVLDLSGVPGLKGAALPPGYTAEVAWASNADVTVIGYGSAFVKAVLDSGSGNSLGDDPRFKALVGRVGPDNIGLSFVDLAAIRALIEPILQRTLSADQWTSYSTNIQPYIKHLDALIGSVRKDGAIDRGTGTLTAH
ncbi:MAG: hypothetical protein NVS9B8_12750 [Candidatus Limnocylindrales bacterium]